MTSNSWMEISLGEIAAEVTVGHVGPMASEYVDEGIPFLRSQNVERLRINLADVKFITPEFHTKLKKSALSPGDVVIVRTGKPGACAVMPESIPVSNCSDLVIVRPGPNLDSRFLAYYINSKAAHQVSAYQVGAVQQHFNVESARNLELKLPNLSEQRAITHILRTLDNKIELNRRMNETLEAMARAIFKSWFVDFDPVKRNAEVRRKKTESTAKSPSVHPSAFTLRPSIAALFPDSFQDSPLGKIPKGWDVKGLDEVADFLNGLALQKFPPDGEDSLPVIKIAQLRAGNTKGADRAGSSLPPEYIVEDGDVLFSWSGSLEVVVWCGGRGALNQHLFKVTSQAYPKWFYYHWIREHLPQFQAIAAGKATTMGHIQRHHLSEAMVVAPNADLLSTADRLIGPLFQSVIANEIQSRTLAAIRDTLLPKLMSGELRVKAAGASITGPR